MAKPEIYVSIDIESDGPYPPRYSMLSLGAAAFHRGRYEPVATFEVNLLPLDGAERDPKTMEWWATQPAAWEHLQESRQSPSDAMEAFAAWASALPGKPILAVYPVWDWGWVNYYLQQFHGRNPFGIAALDMKTLAMALLDSEFKASAKRNMPREWFDGAPRHDHTARTDAIGQGVMLMRMFDRLHALHGAE